MKHARSIAAIGVLSFLAACGSNPARENYYSLVLASGTEPTPSSPTAASNEAGARMIVGPIQLARYLDQRAIPIQTGEAEIQSANHNFWAEPLDEAIAKVLVQDIAQRIETVRVERDAGQWTSNAHCRVRIEFDKFHATSESNVVTAGRFWIYGSDSSAVTTKEFDIARTLSEDGYAHAVQQLRTSLALLATDIVERTESESACTQ